MVNEQPEALRLADECDEHWVCLHDVAAELRRLHFENKLLHERHSNSNKILAQLESVNQELLEALKECIHFVEYDPKNVIGKKAKAAIAKAERTTP